MTLEKEFKNSSKEDLFKSSLFESVVKYSKDIFDYKKPKLSSDIDVNSTFDIQIYDENLIKFLEYSVKESKVKYNSSPVSVVMEYLKKDIDSIDEDKLSPVNRIKKRHLVRVAGICGNMRIVDSQNLKMIYDMYKQPAIKFE